MIADILVCSTSWSLWTATTNGSAGAMTDLTLTEDSGSKSWPLRVETGTPSVYRKPVRPQSKVKRNA